MSTLDLNIILIGKTGNGKSATGNTLLGKERFVAARRGSSVTDTCYAQSTTNRTGKYTVIDTPGLFDTSSLAKRAIDIQRSIKICPEPHAFLLIMNATVRVTPEELCTIEMLKMIFGRSVLNHMIVVFTHGGDFDSDKEFESFWKETPQYKKLVRECGGRVCRIENKEPLSKDKFHNNPIYDLVRTVSNDGQNPYIYDYSKQHEEAFQHHLDSYEGNMESIAQIQAMLEDIDDRIKEENKKREEKARVLRQQLRKKQKDAALKEEEARQREAEALEREAVAAKRERDARQLRNQMEQERLEMMEKLRENEERARREAEERHREEIAKLKKEKKREKKLREIAEKEHDEEMWERKRDAEVHRKERKHMQERLTEEEDRNKEQRQEQERMLRELKKEIERASGEHKRELEELKKKVEEKSECSIQ